MVQPPTFPPGLIQCPKCGKPSDCIKRFKMLDLVVFVGIFAWARRATYTACASCMQKIIAQRMIINLFTANLIWPIIVFSWIGKMIATYSKGHSAAVLEEIAKRRSIP